MILTGNAIEQARADGSVVLDPFETDALNPNSYNFRLGETLIVISHQVDARENRSQIDIPRTGVVLQPRRLYLASTLETIGSSKYAMTILGRSSLGRLGLFLNITADLGHVGTANRWTLELSVVQPLRVYPRMRIGQVAFWSTAGPQKQYQGRYSAQISPAICEDHELVGSLAQGGIDSHDLNW